MIHQTSRILVLMVFASIANVSQTSFAADNSPNYSPEFASQVRQYLLDHPEIILEAMELLSAREAAQKKAEAVAAAHETLLNSGTNLRIGSNQAETVIIEFFDYRCPVCKAALPTLETFVLQNPEIAIIKKHLPIISPGSERASRYILAANKLFGADISNQLHNKLYSTKRPLREEVFEKVAIELGLNHAAIQALTHSDEVTDLIDANRDLAIDLGISGTPAFVSAKRLHIGSVTVDDLAALIAE